MEPSKRKAGRPKGTTKPEKLGPSLKLTLETDRALTAHAHQLKLSKRRYGNAAIAYFATNGFDPTEERPKRLADVGFKVSKAGQAIQEQSAVIGQRLALILQRWEKNLYAFQQQQQTTTNDYLELIESNVLQHQATVATKLLVPMVENLLKANLEVYIARGLMLAVQEKMFNLPADSYRQKMERSNNERDQELAAQLGKFLETHPVPLPKPTRRPAVTPVPAAPPKPAAPAATAPVTPPKS